MRYLLILIILSLFACSSDPSQERETPNSTSETEAAAISLDGKALFPPPESEASRQRKDSLLAIAFGDYQAEPEQLEHHIWYGRRLAYLSRYQEAIAVYTKALAQFPDSPELYRHRGHRYLSIRQFDKAIEDFKKAAELAKDRPIELEPDGIPNKLNQPLSTLQFNIYYHWGLAHYLKGEFLEAARIYEICMDFSTNPDLLTATSDWLYMTYRRLGEVKKAQALLAPITKDLEIIENESYRSRLLFYKGQFPAQQLLDLENNDPEAQLDIVTQGYGVANWYLYNGQEEKAKAILEKLLATDYWPAFGYIAAEADWVRME